MTYPFDAMRVDLIHGSVDEVFGRTAKTLRKLVALHEPRISLDALFVGEENARRRFNAKREEFLAAELRRAVCDACGVGR